MSPKKGTQGAQEDFPEAGVMGEDPASSKSTWCCWCTISCKPVSSYKQFPRKGKMHQYKNALQTSKELWGRKMKEPCAVLCLVVQLCPTLKTPWTVAHQAPLSMGFSRQEYWSGLP